MTPTTSSLLEDSQREILTRTFSSHSNPRLPHVHHVAAPIHISSRLQDGPRRRVEALVQHRSDQKTERPCSSDDDEERLPLLTKQYTRTDGTYTDLVPGYSSLPQTIFNSANVLIGISILSLPLGLLYAGWVIGLGLLAIFALGTRYTAGILAKCLDVDSSLRNYGDVAYIAFGQRGRIATSVVFNMELVCACIALVILFADSLDSLIPGYGLVRWKILCGLILAPLNFFPLRWLSYTSFLGIFCVLALTGVVVVDGLLKFEGLGSLWEPAVTYAMPEHWAALPLSFGLIMAPFGGHAVFPNIYRDMRQPWKYDTALNSAFAFTWLADTCMATVGWLMFGNATKDEITTNILLGDGYPRWMDILLLVLIAIIPLTKFPLTCSPVVSTLETLSHTSPYSQRQTPTSEYPNLVYLLRALIRLFTVLVIVVLAILIPSFEVISAILGAAFCFLICIVLPLAFHIRMFGKSLSRRRVVLEGVVLVVGALAGLTGTVWEVLPRGWMGIEG